MGPEQSWPARKLVTVTPSDSTLLNFRSLWVGGAGDVAIIAIDDTAANTVHSVPAGTELHIAGSKVMATNTTATLITALC